MSNSYSKVLLHHSPYKPKVRSKRELERAEAAGLDLSSTEIGIELQCSQTSKRRAEQLRQFLLGLHTAEINQLLNIGGQEGRLELLVLNRADWQKLYRYPYGLPFTRNQPKKEGNTPRVTIILSASYPERMLAKFNDVYLQAAKEGYTSPSKNVTEFLDMLSGHEWGHAIANLSGLRTGLRWFDEFLATYIYLLALDSSGQEDLKERFLKWSAVSSYGSPSKRDLGSFEFPKGKLNFYDMLWFQGTMSLQADVLFEKQGWDFVFNLKKQLEANGLKYSIRPKRGELTKVLMGLEPDFKEWFSHFAKDA